MDNKLQLSPTTLFKEMYCSQKKQALRVDTVKKQTRKDRVRNGEQQIDDWMEKRRISTRPVPISDNDHLFFSFSSSSSHSSSPGFSSSDSESVRPTKSRDSCFPPIKRKQIRTTANSPRSKPHQNYSYSSVTDNQEMPLTSTSMYAELKKSRLPISPGGKLTTFINSIFNGRRRHERKATNLSSEEEAAGADDFRNPKSQLSYTCSSASSYTRSCLVKKSPSLSSDKSVKKSVRFYPTSIEYSVEIRSRNVEHSPSSIYNRKDENLRFSSTDEYRAGTELVVDEEDKDDAASDTSSELFEIDHVIFATINRNGDGSHGHELPVFETTNVNGSNRAIFNGAIVF